MNIKNNYVAAFSEFIGVVILSTIVLAVSGRTALPFYTATYAGITLALMVMVLGPFSGAHINPIVTISMWAMKKIRTSTAIVYVASQILGGYVALLMNETIIDMSLRSRAGKEFDWHVLAAEALGAAIFTFTIAATVSRSYDQNKTALMIGGGLMLGVITASLTSNGIINPAVAVGIKSWSFAYAVGPILGAMVGTSIYSLIFSPAENKDSTVLKAPKGAAKKSKANAKRKK